jgi:hypothetical protein
MGIITRAAPLDDASSLLIPRLLLLHRTSPDNLSGWLPLNTVGSFVKGLMPAHSFVARFLITTNFANPGNGNAPFFFNYL